VRRWSRLSGGTRGAPAPSSAPEPSGPSATIPLFAPEAASR
jgi:hypothetical protein